MGDKQFEQQPQPRRTVPGTSLTPAQYAQAVRRAEMKFAAYERDRARLEARYARIFRQW